MTALARAEESNRYGMHLIDSALNTAGCASRPRAIGLMGCEHVSLALLAILAPERTRAQAAA